MLNLASFHTKNHQIIDWQTFDEFISIWITVEKISDGYFHCRFDFDLFIVAKMIFLFFSNSMFIFCWFFSIFFLHICFFHQSIFDVLGFFPKHLCIASSLIIQVIWKHWEAPAWGSWTSCWTPQIRWWAQYLSPPAGRRSSASPASLQTHPASPSPSPPWASAPCRSCCSSWWRSRLWGPFSPSHCSTDLQEETSVSWSLEITFRNLVLIKEH